jgi:hypothetical protein
MRKLTASYLFRAFFLFALFSVSRLFNFFVLHGGSWERGYPEVLQLFLSESKSEVRDLSALLRSSLSSKYDIGNPFLHKHIVVSNNGKNWS